MDDRLAKLESLLADLQHTLARIEDRLDTMGAPTRRILDGIAVGSEGVSLTLGAMTGMYQIVANARIPGAPRPGAPRRKYPRRKLRCNFALVPGTANTSAYVRGQGRGFQEPSVIAFDSRDGKRRVIAIGREAEALVRGPTTEVVYPIREGAIADLEAAELMLSQVLDKVGHRRIFRNRRVLVSVPGGATSAERLVLSQAMRTAGASRIYLIEQVLAAAIGAELPVMEPIGSMMVLIGAGCTEAAVMSLGGIAYTTFARVGGESMNQSILSYLRYAHALLTDEAVAERIKTRIGIARAPANGVDRPMYIKGRDAVTAVVKEIELTESDVRDALFQDLDVVGKCVTIALEGISPELSADLVDQGIVLAGGGALLPGLKEWIHDLTGLPVTVADDAGDCVIDGVGQALENPQLRGLVFEYRRG